MTKIETFTAWSISELGEMVQEKIKKIDDRYIITPPSRPKVTWLATTHFNQAQYAAIVEWTE